MDEVRAGWKVSIRRACRVLRTDTSTYHYKGKRASQAGLTKRIKEIAETRVRYGYRRVHVLLRREGWTVNAKRIYRLYKSLGLQLRNKTPKRRVKAKLRDDRRPAVQANETWAMDFVHDQLATGRKIRILTMVDIFTRFAPAPRFSFKAADVVEVLERVGREHGFPKAIRVDQGTEFVSRDLDLWAYQRGVTLDFSRPGKPTDNAFIESLNGKFRAECLNAHWFMSLDDARAKCEAWRRDYNHASEHPSVYVVDGNRHCWPECDSAGCLEVFLARSVMDRAFGLARSARAKIQGPSGKGWIASTSPASAANRSVLGATCRRRAALLRLSQGSFPSSVGLCTGMR